MLLLHCFSLSLRASGGWRVRWLGQHSLTGRRWLSWALSTLCLLSPALPPHPLSHTHPQKPGHHSEPGAGPLASSPALAALSKMRQRSGNCLVTHSGARASLKQTGSCRCIFPWTLCFDQIGQCVHPNPLYFILLWGILCT